MGNTFILSFLVALLGDDALVRARLVAAGARLQDVRPVLQLQDLVARRPFTAIVATLWKEKNHI